MRDPKARYLERDLTWGDSDGDHTLQLYDSATEITSFTTRDVDGALDLVLFVKVDPEVPRTAEATLWIYRMRKDGPLRMSRLELALMGVHDEASLDAEIPLLGKLALGENTSTARLLVRLSWATPDEFRALVAPKGVSFCDRLGENKKCKVTARTDPTLQKRVEASLDFAREATDVDANGNPKLGLPGCSEEANGASCSASRNRPEGEAWRFEGHGRTRRLVEVTSWAEES